MRAARVLPLLLLCVSAISFAGPDEHSKAFWDQKYKEISKIFGTLNRKAYYDMLAPNYKVVDWDGTVSNRAQVIEQENVAFQMIGRASGSDVVTGVKTVGDTVQVKFLYKYRLAFKTPKGANNKFTIGREVGTDYWKKIGGKWMTVKSVLTVNVYTVFDVQPRIRHGKVGGG